ncbi:MAG: hypothetical protein J6W28_08940, partial [Clostridia bacterium]|nr:hypothetical protein [Clostridia bacterium]
QHLATLASAYANTTMVLDDNGSGDDYYEIHDALTNDLQEIVDLMHPAEKTEYDELYAAQDHLVALYTAFDKEASVLVENGLWKNQVAGEHATIGNNNASIKITAGENGGLTIGGTHTKDTYNGNTAPTVGIKLSDSYLDLNAFTVESASILRGVAYTTVSGGETVADTLDNAGNWQNFRFGALSCDYWINLNGKVRLHMNWRNVVIGAGQAYYNGVRETTLRQAYDAAGNVYAGKTQTVTMTKNDDGGRAYAVYYGSTKVTLQDKNNPLGQPTITKDQYDAVLAETPKLGWFYLFAGTPGDVYAIRVYDKVLTDDERLHNHLVDLLAFYEIDLPSNVAALDLSALAEKHGATSFFDEGEAVKAELQKDLDFASFTVNVGVETRVVEKDDAFYAAVRFTASIDKAIADKYEIKSYGILIAPKAYVDAADAFTAEALEAYLASEGVENNGSAESRAYLNVVADGFYAETDETYTIAGGFANFSLKTKENNPAFAAVAYAVVEIEGEDVVVYGSYNEDACITVKETLAAARQAIYLENAADPRLDVYDEVLAQFN